MKRLLFSVLLTLSFSVRAADEDPVKTAARASLERIQALRKERPGDGLLVYYEALTRIAVGERDSAFDLLRSLTGRKLGLIPAHGAGFDAVWNDPGFEKIRKELEAAEPRTKNAPVAFRLSDPTLIPEGIAYDAAGQRFFVGSVAKRKIIVTDTKGVARDFSSPADKLDCVLGLTIDAARGHLYAVSTNGFMDEAKKERRNAVLRYDLKTGLATASPSKGEIAASKPVRVVAPEAMQLNDLAIASDGTLYVTDSEAGTLYRKKPDESALTRFGENGALRGANGIAIAGDGAIYVTLSTGIARVDTATGAPVRLPQPDTMVTGGCDGLYWHNGDLIGVQNGPNPGRIIRIGLADRGQRIASLAVLQSHHHPEFDEPTTGAIANGTLNVIGNSYVGHHLPDGSITGTNELKGTAIVAVPLK